MEDLSKQNNIMKQTIYIFLSALMMALGANAQVRKQCIDEDWQFHYGVLDAIPTDYTEWRTIRLPHDWGVETEAAEQAGGTVVGPFTTNNVGGAATGCTIGGEGWYHKALTFDSSYKNKKVGLYFDGVYNYAIIYINGVKVYFNHYGYTGFHVDITPYIHIDGKANDLLVQVQNIGYNTRWYAGSGIYRHVWLQTTPKVHLDEWGTRINHEADIENETCNAATINVSTTISNETLKDASGEVKASLVDKNGNVVAQNTMPFTAAAKDETKVSIPMEVTQPQLWSPEHPYLYHVNIETSTPSGKDYLDIPYGIRNISFSPTDGFMLNGKKVLLQGGCVHHDLGLIGTAAWDKAEERKIRLLKEQGFNALRSSHNMQSETFLYLCDSLGMMFMDECFDQWYIGKNSDDYHNFFEEYHSRDLQVMLKRDYNHPSIIMWSIGNEIGGRCEDNGIKVAKEMREVIRSYDTNRAITGAVCYLDAPDWETADAKAFLSMDVCGYNYLDDKYEQDHAAHPDRIFCGTETFPMKASQNWDLAESKPYVIGDFVWTAMDYLGEAGIGCANWESSISWLKPWPWFNGWCGDIDLIGQKKPQSYFRDVVWHRAPITMAVEQPHTTESISNWGWAQEHQSWTWPEYEQGKDSMFVNVYSRASKVRLYLNGRLVGEGTPDETYRKNFKVTYEPGTLKAVNVENGVESDCFELTTTGKPAGIKLTADHDIYSANGNDLAYVTIELIDAEGRVINNNSTEEVTIKVEGGGTLLASGNASPTDMASFRNTSPTLFEGRALAIIHINKQEGDVKVNVSNSNYNRTLVLKKQ